MICLLRCRLLTQDLQNSLQMWIFQDDLEDGAPPEFTHVRGHQQGMGIQFAQNLEIKFKE